MRDLDLGDGVMTAQSAGWDVFVAELDASGNPLWKHQLGGASNDMGSVGMGRRGRFCA